MNRVFIVEYSSTEYQWKLRLQAPTIWRGRGRVGGTGGKRKGKGDFGGGFESPLEGAFRVLGDGFRGCFGRCFRGRYI